MKNISEIRIHSLEIKGVRSVTAIGATSGSIIGNLQTSESCPTYMVKDPQAVPNANPYQLLELQYTHFSCVITIRMHYIYIVNREAFIDYTVTNQTYT